jgi:hypothetical protein
VYNRIKLLVISTAIASPLVLAQVAEASTRRF